MTFLFNQHVSIHGIPVNVFSSSIVITHAELINFIRSSVSRLAFENPNLNPSDFGTHSVRSGSALAMYLHEVPVADIMLQGRWSSNSFMLCIKRHVLERSQGALTSMIASDSLHSLPPRSDLQLPHRSPTLRSFTSDNQLDYIRAPNLHLHY